MGVARRGLDLREEPLRLLLGVLPYMLALIRPLRPQAPHPGQAEHLGDDREAPIGFVAVMSITKMRSARPSTPCPLVHCAALHRVQATILMSTSHDGNVNDLRGFYTALAELEARLGGLRDLESCRRREVPARRGVYFFFESGEVRTGSGCGPRVVRVGTHGLGTGSVSTLWSRLRQHRGASNGGGNQRGSIFRRHVGAALMDAGLVGAVPDWWVGSNATSVQRKAEEAVERRVSGVIRRMPFVVLAIDDAAGPSSDRGYIERNAISLLSDPITRCLDPPSSDWLGRHARAAEIRESGLWNVRHVGETMNHGFIERLWQHVREAA